MRETTGIKKIDRWAGMSDWNRDKKWDSGEYARYDIKVNPKGGYNIPYYYALCISHGGEDYELYFAPYDLEAVKGLTGITVITE